MQFEIQEAKYHVHFEEDLDPSEHVGSLNVNCIYRGLCKTWSNVKDDSFAILNAPVNPKSINTYRNNPINYRDESSANS